MALIQVISGALDYLYEYDWARTLKEYLRPFKHALLGKGEVYLVIEDIGKARGADNPVRTIFDVGAAIGDKTITFLKSFPDAAVYCFEPQEESLIRLKRRTRQWGGRVKAFGVGLGTRECTADLHIISHRDASSLLTFPKYLKDQGKKEVYTKEVAIKNLDDVVAANKIDRIDLIKIDVEGAEKGVLEGGYNTFQNKVDNIFIEIDPWRKDPRSADHIDVFKFLHDAGFTFIGVYGDYFFSKDKDVLKRYFDNLV